MIRVDVALLLLSIVALAMSVIVVALIVYGIVTTAGPLW